MSAAVIALHGDRTRALVQRPRRKAHVASIGAGETDWIALCGRLIAADGTDFWLLDDTGTQHTDEGCLDCTALVALADWVAANALAKHGVHPAPVLDVEWETYLLQQDAALVASLTVEGRLQEAEAHIDSSRYRERLAAVRAARSAS